MKKTVFFLILLMGVAAFDVNIVTAVPSNDPIELVANREFSQNGCLQDSCIFDFKTPNAIRNWIFDPRIEIGKGSDYSDNLENQNVVILGPNPYTCIKQ